LKQIRMELTRGDSIDKYVRVFSPQYVRLTNQSDIVITFGLFPRRLNLRIFTERKAALTFLSEFILETLFRN